MRWLVAIVAAGFVGACSTSNEFTVGEGAAGKTYRSAYLVTHSDDKEGMPAHIMGALTGLGLSTTSGPEPATPPAADLIVRYNDKWRWDISMYLARFKVEVFDRRTGLVAATGQWENSAVHGYHEAKGVVTDTVNKTFTQLGFTPPPPPPPPAKKPSAPGSSTP